MIKSFKEAYDLNSITLNVTNNCNLNCSYCFEHKKSDAIMTTETAIEIIKCAYKKVNPKIGTFTFNIFGGEPLLNWPVIKDMVDYTNKNHIVCKFGITTNLTMLTDEMIEYIDDNDIMMLVSFDGVGHDANRNNTHDLVSANIKKLIDKGLGHLIEARMTITPEFGKDLCDSVKEVVELGINNICPMCVTDTDWSDDEIKVLQGSYEDLLQYYTDLLNDKNNKRNISIKFVDELIGMVLDQSMSATTMCHIGNIKWCAIDTNGDVYPCHNCPTSDKDYIKAMKIGNIYTGVETDLISELPEIAKFDRPECDDCIGKIVCKSGCPIQNLTCNGDRQIPTVAHCKISRMYVESLTKYQKGILDSNNSKSRYLNLIKENLKIKVYFDEELSKTEIHTIDFKVKLDRFKEMYNNLKQKENVLPNFEIYFKLNLAGIMSWVLAERGKKYGK